MIILLWILIFEKPFSESWNCLISTEIEYINLAGSNLIAVVVVVVVVAKLAVCDRDRGTGFCFLKYAVSYVYELLFDSKIKSISCQSISATQLVYSSRSS